MLKNKYKISVIVFLVALIWPSFAYAHEAYVLPYTFFWKEIQKPFDTSAFQALQNSSNLKVTFFITIGIILVYVLYSLFRSKAVGRKINGAIERLAPIGPVFVRVAIAVAFFESAQTNSFLGPELYLSLLPHTDILRILLYMASFMILLGIFTEVAAIISLIIFTTGFLFFGAYLFTYLNYLGEVIALLLFGLRSWSIDKSIFGALKGWRQQWEKYGSVIVRIFYGTALLYAGVSVKLLHADLTLRVIHDWNLTQFHWLFPHDPLLIVLGGGLAEATIGLFIILGFQTRLTVLISLFYITLSLLFFREMVWPHILLYGISLNLLVQPETFSLDHYLFGDKNSKIAPWRRFFKAA